MSKVYGIARKTWKTLELMGGDSKYQRRGLNDWPSEAVLNVDHQAGTFWVHVYKDGEPRLFSQIGITSYSRIKVI